MATFDYIAEARAITDALSDDLLSWKLRTDEIIAAGSTGTEILMGLRWSFGELVATEPSLPPDVIKRIKNFLAAANRLLG